MNQPTTHLPIEERSPDESLRQLTGQKTARSIALRSATPLFASPLLTFQLSACESINALLLMEIAAMHELSNGIERSNQNGWHSPNDFFGRGEPGCKELRTHILEALRQATLQIAPTFDFSTRQLQMEGWVNVSGRGGYNTPHDHPGYAWSGCYYVAVPENPPGRSGSIEFLDPRTNVRVVTVDDATCFVSKVTMQPQAGMLLLFPSYLYHWVYPNEQDFDRVSIAFNARFLRRPHAVQNQS
jgi:uncharacterized protein (TIGR02466 family)